MKKAFIVCGPESSGNHLMASILVRQGCSLQLKIDFSPPSDGPVVWQGSMPKNRLWYKISDVAEKYRKHGFDVTLVVLSRNWYAMACSQVEKHAPTGIQEAFSAISKAYRHIFAEIEKTKDLRYVMVNYESLIYEQDSFLQKLIPMLFDSEVEMTNEASGKLPEQSELNTSERRYSYYFDNKFYNANRKWLK